MLKTSATDGQPKADALTALNACYVLAMERYVDTRISSDSQGSELCIDLLKALPVHHRSLGGFLEDVGENKAAYDRRLNDQIGNKARAACPDAATVLLGAYAYFAWFHAGDERTGRKVNNSIPTDEDS